MFGDTIRAVIDLLRVKQEARKADLQIDELERKKKQSDALIQIASFTQIEEFDPRVAELHARMRKPLSAKRRRLRLRWVLIIFAVIALSGITYLLFSILS